MAKEVKMNKNEDDIMLQIVNGIAEAVNGEGFEETVMEDISMDGDGSVTVQLADMPGSMLASLVAEINERVSLWRVNPFEMIDYQMGGKLIFHLKPMEVIRTLYEKRRG